MDVKPGDYVAWKWAGGIAEGRVIAVSTERTQIMSNSKLITRNGTPDNPAVTIDHKSGNPVLKLSTELLNPNN